MKDINNVYQMASESASNKYKLRDARRKSTQKGKNIAEMERYIKSRNRKIVILRLSLLLITLGAGITLALKFTSVI